MKENCRSASGTVGQEEKEWSEDRHIIVKIILVMYKYMIVGEPGGQGDRTKTSGQKIGIVV